MTIGYQFPQIRFDRVSSTSRKSTSAQVRQPESLLSRGHLLLQNISFEVLTGEHVAIVEIPQVPEKRPFYGY